MKNNKNKIISSLLMMSALTTLVAGTLSINRNVYRKAEAAVGNFRIIYLSVPNPVTKSGAATTVEWDGDDDYMYMKRVLMVIICRWVRSQPIYMRV